MRCRLMSTVAGLLCAAGFVQAQDFAPKPLQPISISSVAPAALPVFVEFGSLKLPQSFAASFEASQGAASMGR